MKKDEDDLDMFDREARIRSAFMALEHQKQMRQMHADETRIGLIALFIWLFLFAIGCFILLTVL